MARFGELRLVLNKRQVVGPARPSKLSEYSTRTSCVAPHIYLLLARNSEHKPPRADEPYVVRLREPRLLCVDT